MKIVRPLIYLAIIAVAAIVVEIKKIEVRTERTKSVESVLSLILEEGLPISTYEVEERDFNRFSLFHVKECSSNQYCFFISGSEKEKFALNARIFDPKNMEVIGRVLSIANRPNVATGLFEIRTELTSINEEKFIGVGHRAQANSIVIPIESVVQTRDGAHVFVFKNGDALKKEIVVDGISMNEVRVTSGLSKGDIVIVEGMSLLSMFNRYHIVGKWSAK